MMARLSFGGDVADEFRSWLATAPVPDLVNGIRRLDELGDHGTDGASVLGWYTRHRRGAWALAAGEAPELPRVVDPSELVGGGS